MAQTLSEGQDAGTLRADQARRGGGLGHARRPAQSARPSLISLAPIHLGVRRSGSCNGTLWPSLSPRTGRGGPVLHPRRRRAALAGAP